MKNIKLKSVLLPIALAISPTFLAHAAEADTQSQIDALQRRLAELESEDKKEQARKENTLVLLDGQGMDEQWAGYDYYTQKNDATIQGVNNSPFKQHVLSKELLDLAEKPIYPKPFNDELLNKQYRDLFYTKIPRALRFNDRVSMAYSTELREPCLLYTSPSPRDS